MNGKSTNGTAGGGMLACIEGLPPLPKSLSGLLNSAGGSWRDMERMYVKKTMIQDDLSRGRNHHGGDGGPLASKKPPANLDAALALLRKEMVGLRQQDMSLLCQLWSLHESIQEYKGSCHDLSAASENGCYFDEDDEYYGEAGPGGPTTPGGEEPDEDATTATSSSAKNGGGGSNGGSSSSNDSSSSSWLQDSFHVTI